MLHIILILLESLGERWFTALSAAFLVLIPVVLWLFKWIGILALIVLGLIVFAALLVLLVPVRYRVNGSWHERGKGRVRITWLLHILSITAAYDQKLKFSVRLFGYPVLKPGKNEKELHGEDDFVVQAMEVKEPQDGRSGACDDIPAEGKLSKQADSENTGKETHSGNSGKQTDVKNVKIGKWKEKALGALTRFQASFKSFCSKLKTMKEKKEEVLKVLNKKENQKTIKLILKQGKRALRHILPVKGNGRLIFGFEDPYLTGQVLMAASAAYPFYHKRLTITPVFDQNVFQGEGSFRGRIRLGTLVFIGLRLLFHKNFRTLLKKWLR